LESLHPILSKISKEYSNVKILIISRGMPNLPDVKLETREWSEEKETDDLLSIDIGLMPMANDDWSKGKCALKAIQYMAAGIPVVCADVGANREVVRHAIDGFRSSTDIEWKTYLERLINDSKLRATMGKSGRKRIKQYYNLENESRTLATWLHEELNQNHRKNETS
jgi:glycosyltransferase involved in cell wall biosynthesis